MAVGTGPLLPLYGHVEVIQKKKMDNRLVAVGGFIVLAMCAAVALVGMSPSSPTPTSLMAKVRGRDLQLATGLIKAAPTASVTELEQMLNRWKSEDISSLGEDRTQMLAQYDGLQTTLADSSGVCAKKDVIFAKLDQLVAKLAAQGAVLNTTDADAYEAKIAALTSWLDSESAYRLMAEKVKEAKEGARFARSQYEKMAETVKTTQERVDLMLSQYGKEQSDLQAEKDLIREIMRLLGILEDQPLDEKSAAAGGYMKPSSARANPVALQEIKRKMSELKQRIGGEGKAAARMQQLDAISSKLASYAETDEIKKILTDLLKDVDQRLEVIQGTLVSSQQELATHKAKLIKYETELVDLSNAADKAEQKMDTQNLARQKLSGNKVTTSEAYKDEHSAYLMTSPPTERELFIIQVIKKKVNEFCTK